MIVALSRFTIANDMVARVRTAFENRPHLVDSAPGFLGMEVMNPIGNTSEIWLLTRWSDEGSFKRWHDGPEYQGSHGSIPKGLKLVPGSTQVLVLDVFAE
jgi:heme-degrading monooxygenase HmoA